MLFFCNLFTERMVLMKGGLVWVGVGGPKRFFFKYEEEKYVYFCHKILFLSKKGEELGTKMLVKYGKYS